MAFLREVGVPLERMARLQGGLDGWKKAGRPTPRPAGSARAGIADVAALLAQAGVDTPRTEFSLAELDAKLGEGRAALLAFLKERGVSNLADRQRLANTFSKAKRDGRLPSGDRSE